MLKDCSGKPGLNCEEAFSELWIRVFLYTFLAFLLGPYEQDKHVSQQIQFMFHKMCKLPF